MADFLFDLETMAANVQAATNHRETRLQDVHRWQRLFKYSYAQAKQAIEEWRATIDRRRVPDDHWEMVRDEKERKGYDREAYEYAGSRNTRPPPTNTSSAKNATYILKLEGPLASVEKVQAVAQLPRSPETAIGVGQSGDTLFCTIDSVARQKVMDWIAVSHPTFRPTVVRLSKSPKLLDDSCMAPAWGFDATLPHHRPSSQSFKPEPAQDQYPVWYCFYGNLARADELQQRLGLPEPPSYVPAVVQGGRIRGWRGQYRALVDAEGDTSHREHGSAYLVTSEEHEDILRFCETEKYEVVRCNIEMEGRTQKGLVFRFAGGEDELTDEMAGGCQLFQRSAH